MRIPDVTELSGHEWFPDTGATAHVTSSPQHLQHSQPYTGSDTVMVGDGNFLPITYIGSALLPSTSGTLPLTDVFVCPDISLLFVSKLTTDYPCSLSEDIWHRRLGHPNAQFLHQLSADKAISISKSTKAVCDACRL